MSDSVEDNGKSTVGDWAWLKRLEHACEALTAVALALMVVIISVDIVTRNVFHFSLQISDEVCGYLLVAATFLAMPVSLARGGWHKVHFLEDRLGERARLGMQVIVWIMSLAVCIVIEGYLIRYVVLGYRSGSAAMTDLNTPLWIPQALMPIGFGILCVFIAAVIVTTISRFRATSPSSTHAVK